MLKVGGEVHATRSIVVLPNRVVVDVDLIVAVAIGGEATTGLSEGVAPHDVVGRVDHSILVVVPRQEVGLDDHEG